MKRQQVCVFFLMIVVALSCSAKTKYQPETKASMFELCFKLWKSTNFGWDYKQSERAAWIIRDPNGRYLWLEWPYSSEHKAATWKGPVPEGVVAQMHTHPAFADPEPSKQDARVAKEINAPVYTINAFGIWSVDSDGGIRQETNDQWHRGIKERKPADQPKIEPNEF